MVRYLAFALALIGSTTMLPAEEIVSIPQVDYLHDQYDNTCLGDTPGYLARLQPYPPQVLQIGKVAPFVHSYGPIAGWGGENQGFGGWTKRTDFARLLTPDELRQRFADLKRLTAGAKAAGVKTIMPYGCMLTFFSNPEQRLGMHLLYDRWDQYAEWLGPRPPLAPENWLARNADGTPWFFYGSRKDVYEPYWRFTACIQNPGWRAWMAAYVKNLVAAGYNGVMLDNVCKMRCQCEYCQQRFQQVLREKYTPQQFHDRFGLDDYAKLTLKARTPDAALEGHAQAGMIEVLRFELDNCVEFLRFIRAEGRKWDPVFSTCCNISHIRHLEEAYAEADFGLVEGAGWWGPYQPLGVSGQHYPGKLDTGQGPPRYCANAFNCAAVHLIPGEHRAFLMQVPAADGAAGQSNGASALLAFAEAEALAGGRATPMVAYSTPLARSPQLDELNWARRTWFEFTRMHQPALVGLHREPPLGIVFNTRQVFLWGDLNAHLEAMELAETLQDMNIEFELVPLRNCMPALLGKYRAVVVPQMQWMDQATLDGLAQYGQQGGTLLLSGPCAGTDDRGNARPADRNPFSGAPAKLPAKQPLGQGQIVFYQCYPIARDPQINDLYKSYKLGPFDEPAWRQALALAGLAPEALPLVTSDHPHLKAVRWLSHDNDGAMVAVHVLNYDTPLGLDNRGKLTPARQVALRVPLPKNMKAQTVKAFAPRYADTQLATEPAYKTEPGVVTLTLPEVGVYGLVEIVARPAGGTP